MFSFFFLCGFGGHELSPLCLYNRFLAELSHCLSFPKQTISYYVPIYCSSKCLILSLEKPCKLAGGFFYFTFEENVADPKSDDMQYRFNPRVTIPSLEINDLKKVGVGWCQSLFGYW